MPSKRSIFAIVISTLRRNNRPRAPSHNDRTVNVPQMVDSAFSTSTNGKSKWEVELEHLHQTGQQLAINWHQHLENLTLLMDKVTSPFLNTNRISLHRAQLFIESYRDDWKNERYDNTTYEEKVRQAAQRFSDQPDLKQCALGILELEKNLFDYQTTMDQQLTSLWGTRHKYQSAEFWKECLEHYHHELNEMKTKFMTLLESSSPNPDEYTCAVCLSIFTDPITLQPCLHTFCKDCIQHIYCTCQLSHCDSACHDATNQPSNLDDDDDHSTCDFGIARAKNRNHLSQRIFSTYKPRYRSMIPPKALISKPTSSGQHSCLRSPLTRFKVSASSTMTQVSTTNTTPYPVPPALPPTSADDGDDDSAMEIPSPLTTTPSNTVNINAGSVTLQCFCPLSWSIPPAAQCPLCRHPFGPENCISATSLDNLIRFYFPRRDKVRRRYNARQRQLQRRSFFTSLANKCLPSSLVSVPLPSRRLPPMMSEPPPAVIPMMMMV